MKTELNYELTGDLLSFFVLSNVNVISVHKMRCGVKQIYIKNKKYIFTKLQTSIYLSVLYVKKCCLWILYNFDVTICYIYVPWIDILCKYNTEGLDKCVLCIYDKLSSYEMVFCLWKRESVYIILSPEQIKIILISYSWTVPRFYIYSHWIIDV